jgi:hypothetical protein
MHFGNRSSRRSPHDAAYSSRALIGASYGRIGIEAGPVAVAGRNPRSRLAPPHTISFQPGEANPLPAKVAPLEPVRRATERHHLNAIGDIGFCRPSARTRPALRPCGGRSAASAELASPLPPMS